MEFIYFAKLILLLLRQFVNTTKKVDNIIVKTLIILNENNNLECNIQDGGIGMPKFMSKFNGIKKSTTTEPTASGKNTSGTEKNVSGKNIFGMVKNFPGKVAGNKNMLGLAKGFAGKENVSGAKSVLKIKEPEGNNKDDDSTLKNIIKFIVSFFSIILVPFLPFYFSVKSLFKNSIPAFKKTIQDM